MDKTFLKGLLLVEAIARSDQPRGITELAKELGLTKSNVHRLLQTLVHAGYAYQEPSQGRYALGVKVCELGLLVLSRVDVQRFAAPHLQSLMQETGESAYVAILDQGQTVYIDKVEGSHPVRAYAPLGSRAPAYCVATGKALLAHQPPEVVDQASSHIRIYTANTVKNRRELDQELERVRRQGYAINNGEWRESVCGLAAPIFDASNRAIAAIGISGPSDRLRPRVLRNLAGSVTSTARAISQSMGQRLVEAA